MIKYDFYAGFSRVDVTPMLGIAVSGYFKPRYFEGVLDTLEINAVALQKDGATALLATIDNVGVAGDVLGVYRQKNSRGDGYLSRSGVYSRDTYSHWSRSVRTRKSRERFAERILFFRHAQNDGRRRHGGRRP